MTRVGSQRYSKKKKKRDLMVDYLITPKHVAWVFD